MAYMTRLTKHDKITLSVDLDKLKELSELCEVSIDINLAIPGDLYNDKGEPVHTIKTYIQASNIIRIEKTKPESSSGM